ncbi:hypothetical protein NBRC116494_18210 [Aurantivibrio plasticivorans]
MNRFLSAIFKTPFILFLLLPLGACSYHYMNSSTDEWLKRLELKSHHNVTSLRRHTIPRFNRVCVSRPFTLTPADLRAEASQVLAQELGYLYRSVDGPQMASSHREAMLNAARQRCDFLFDLDVVLDEDQVASVGDFDNGVDQFSDLGFDQLGLKVSIWDVRSAQLVDTSLVTSRTSFLSFAASSPSDLVQKSIRLYVDSVAIQQ